jgi:hypothetical protein
MKNLKPIIRRMMITLAIAGAVAGGSAAVATPTHDSNVVAGCGLWGCL